MLKTEAKSTESQKGLYLCYPYSEGSISKAALHLSQDPACWPMHGCKGMGCSEPAFHKMTLFCRQRLADALEAHGQQGCPGRPSFGMDSLAPGTDPALVMHCSSCACVHVVV